MAKYINRVQLAAPATPTATLSAGGTLPIGTTYYYRVAAFRKYTGNNCAIISPVTAEVSATTDATNRTITFSWTAVTNAFGYIVQRTTTSGSYPVGGYNTFTITSHVFYLTTLTGVADAGTQRWDGQNIDLTDESPLIEVYATAGETIYSYEILDAAVAGGWTSVRTNFPPGLVASADSAYRRSIPLSFTGSLYIHDCTFVWDTGFTIINGSFWSDSTTIFSTDATWKSVPMLLTFGLTYPQYTNNNTTLAGSFGCYSQINGSGNLYGLIQKMLSYFLAYGQWGYGPLLYMQAIQGTINFYAGDVGHGISNSLPINGGNFFGSLIGSGYPNLVNLTDSIVYQTGRIPYNVSYKRCRLTMQGICSYFTLYTGANFEDCIFDYGLDNVIVGISTTSFATNTTCNFVYNISLILSDENGNPIEGADIEIKDLNGNSALFADSGATFSTSLNDTDSSSSFVVSNGALFTVGDIIRCENMGELYLVTGKATNTLTITRGYGGTSKRRTIGNLGPNKKVLKQVASIQTDADGLFETPFALIHAEYTHLVSINVNDTLQGLIDDGYLERKYHTPHTITISKAGHKSYTDKITMDEKKVMEIALSKIKDLNFSKSVKRISQ